MIEKIKAFYGSTTNKIEEYSSQVFILIIILVALILIGVIDNFTNKVAIAEFTDTGNYKISPSVDGSIKEYQVTDTRTGLRTNLLIIGDGAVIMPNCEDTQIDTVYVEVSPEI